MLPATLFVALSITSCEKICSECIMKDVNNNVLGSYESCAENPEQDAEENFCSSCGDLSAHCEQQ